MLKELITRPDLSSASLEFAIIMAGAFLLGFLFCYFQGPKE